MGRFLQLFCLYFDFRKFIELLFTLFTNAFLGCNALIISLKFVNNNSKSIVYKPIYCLQIGKSLLSSELTRVLASFSPRVEKIRILAKSTVRPIFVPDFGKCPFLLTFGILDLRVHLLHLHKNV